MSSYSNVRILLIVSIANCQALIKQGIRLSNLYGVGAPSQPNYIDPASGDTFGLNSDSFILVDKSISTIVDLLEDKGISWSDYNEGLPYTGFEGYEYDPGLYQRKHNLLARFESIRFIQTVFLEWRTWQHSTKNCRMNSCHSGFLSLQTCTMMVTTQIFAPPAPGLEALSVHFSRTSISITTLLSMLPGKRMVNSPLWKIT